MKKVILVIFFLFTNVYVPEVYADQDEQFQKQIEEIMKAREEMLKSLMDDNGDMEQKMMEMMERFSQGGLPGFDIGELEGPVVGEYDWITTDTHKILKIKVKQIKDKPLDIRIEKGMVKIKGDVETTTGTGNRKVVRKTNFERSFSLPDDIDQTSPEFENKNGEFLIKFKRLATAKFKKVAPPVPSKKSDERVPVSPNSDDLNI